MSVLGKVEKQPDEVETWAIDYIDDLEENEQITIGYAMVCSRSLLGKKFVTVPYSVVGTDNRCTIIVTNPGTVTITQAVAGPGGSSMWGSDSMWGDLWGGTTWGGAIYGGTGAPSTITELYVSNSSNGTVIVESGELIGGQPQLSIPVGRSVVLIKSNSTWNVEAYIDLLIISNGDDQRARVTFHKGAPKRKYKIEVTANTNANPPRTLQDEIQVDVKEK